MFAIAQQSDTIWYNIPFEPPVLAQFAQQFTVCTGRSSADSIVRAHSTPRLLAGCISPTDIPKWSFKNFSARIQASNEGVYVSCRLESWIYRLQGSMLPNVDVLLQFLAGALSVADQCFDFVAAHRTLCRIAKPLPLQQHNGWWEMDLRREFLVLFPILDHGIY